MQLAEIAYTSYALFYALIALAVGYNVPGAWYLRVASVVALFFVLAYPRNKRHDKEQAKRQELLDKIEREMEDAK